MHDFDISYEREGETERERERVSERQRGTDRQKVKEGLMGESNIP